MKKLSLVLFMFLFAVGFALAQRTVVGALTDDAGDALIGASVLVKGTSAGTVTDIDGKYSVDVPAGANTLVFSYTGYETQELELGVSNVVNITLNEGVTLETAVVTALGVRRDEKALGYAVQEVDSDDIMQTNTNSVIDALSGKAAGVYVNSSGGAAGASSRIVLRGQTSFNGSNGALIVVDGVRLDNSENSTERTLGGVAYSNRGMDVNPNDIESVSVLKGAAAAALYGVEGARGVLLITTKSGQSGKTRVDFSTNFTASQVSQLPELQEQYSQGGLNEWYGPDGFEPNWWGGFVRATSWGANLDTLFYDGSDYKWDKNGQIVGPSSANSGKAVEAYDNVGDLFQTGKRWNNNLSISGGNEIANYRFSFGNTSEEGITPKNEFDRTNFGLKAGAKLFDGKVDATASLNYVRSKGRRIQQGSNTSGIMLGLLRTPVTFDNANGVDGAEESEAYQFPDGSQRNYRGGGGYDNPYWIINNAPFFDETNRMFGSVRLAYNFSPWATLSTTIGTDFYADNRKQEFELGSRNVPAGQVIEDNYNYRHVDAFVNLAGNGNLSDDFTLGYNIGTNFYDELTKNNYIQGDGLNFVGFRELGNTQSVVSIIDNTPNKNFSMFGSLDLGYKNFLYLTLTGRNDWVSSLIVPTKAFDAGDISVFYPSASLSFVFSELMEANDVLSYGKLRASYAEVGGGAPNPYSTGTPYNVPNTTGLIYTLGDGWTNGLFFPFQGLSGYTYSPLQGNISLVPSTTKDTEVGVDLRFLNSRITLDAAYYTRQSVDQIIAIQVPSSTGFQRATINSGELATNGVEIVLGLTPVRSRDFTWDIQFNFSKWKTTVESLPEGVPNQYLDGFTGTGVYNIAPEEDGTTYEYGQLLGSPFQRVNTDNGTFDASLPWNPDGALIIDDSGSNDPNSDDYNDNYGFPMPDPINRVIGNPNPDFLLGINNTLNYKGLSLSFLFDIKQGGEMWNGTLGAITFFGRSKLTEDRVPIAWSDDYGAVHDYAYANANPNAPGVTVFDGVMASNGNANNINVPLDENWYSGNGGGFGAVSEHFIQDASYYRLRYVTLSYNFGKLIKGSVLDDLTINFTGRNLLLFTPYEGVDPETSLVGAGNGQGLEYFQLPGTRSYSVGLNARF